MRSRGHTDRRSLRDDSGMVTAELAACLPVLVLLLAVALSAVTVAGARVRAADAAHEAARAVARGAPELAAQLAEQSAPGVRLRVTRTGQSVAVVATMTVRPLGGWLPSVDVNETSSAWADDP